MAKPKLTLEAKFTGQGVINVDDVVISDRAKQSIKQQLESIQGLKLEINNAVLNKNAVDNLKNQLSQINFTANVNGLNLKSGAVQKQAQQLGQAVGQSIQQGLNGNNSAIETFKKSLSNAGKSTRDIDIIVNKLKALNVQIQSLQYTEKNGILNINGSGLDEFGNKVRITQRLLADLSDGGSSISIISTKELEKANNAFNNYTQKLAQFKSTNASILSGLNQPLTEFESKLAGLKNGTVSIDEVKNSFSRLNAEASKISQNFTGQLSKTDAAIRRLSQSSEEIKQLEISIKNLNNTPTSINTDLSNVKNLLSEIKNIETQEGRSSNWSAKYKEWELAVDSLKGKIATLKKEEESLNMISSKLPTIQDNFKSGTYISQIAQLEERYLRFGNNISTIDAKMNELKGNFLSFNSEMENYNTVMQNSNATDEQKAQALERLSAAEKTFQASLKSTSQSISLNTSTYMSRDAVNNLISKLEEFRQKNSAITREAKAEIQGYIDTLRNAGTVAKSTGNSIVSNLNRITVEQRNMGRLGLNAWDTLVQGMQKFAYWTSSTYIIMRTFQAIKNSISTVTALDTALVDLRKTAKMTADELNSFYYSANDTAKQMGVTTQEIIEQAAAWSRLGYSTAETATQMAKYSSMFATISPGMDIDTATDGLVSVMKAFKIGADDVNEVVDGIMSKINIIGNNKALSNSDIVDFLTRSSSAMAVANNSLEETIALGEAAVEITRDAASVGNVLKTTSMRIRGYNEITEEYSEDIEELTGKIADLTKTAKTPGGISLFTDNTKETYKSTYQILEEISEIYDELNDKTQAALLEALAGKRNGQALAAIITNFDSAREAMDLMANSAGSAEAEMEIAMDSIEKKATILKETMTGVAQNLFQRDDMKDVISVLQGLADALDFVTDKLGLFGTAALGIGAFAGIKNFGRSREDFKLCFEYAE